MERMLEATALAEENHFWFRGLRRNARLLLEAALDGRRGGTIVDCGSGTGRNLDWLGQYGIVTGIERSAAGLRLGRPFRRRVVQGTVTQLPFRDASVDVVTSFDVLYCLDDDSERQAIREMWRVLKPGGIALVSVAALDILRGSHSTLTNEFRRYTPARLAARLTGAGFSIARMTFTHMTVFPLTLTARLIDQWSGRAHVPSEADLRVPPAPVNELLNAAMVVDAALLRLINLPIGSSVMCVAQKRPRPARG